MKLLLVVFAIVIFGASVPTSCFVFMKPINLGGQNGQGMEELKKFLNGMGGGKMTTIGGGSGMGRGGGGMGGGGGGSPNEPLDFEGVFTRSMRKLQRQVLKHTNRYRRLHGVQPLEEDEKLNRYAQAWALMMAKMDRMRHRTRPQYGENLFMYWSSNMQAPITGRMPVKSWYDEIKLYNYNNPGFKSGTGHFTQLVWKDCRRLGTGVARSKKGTIYIASVYEPRGNIMGRFAEQVPRPISGGGGRDGSGGGSGGSAGRGGGGHNKRRHRRRRHHDDEDDDE